MLTTPLAALRRRGGAGQLAPCAPGRGRGGDPRSRACGCARAPPPAPHRPRPTARGTAPAQGVVRRTTPSLLRHGSHCHDGARGPAGDGRVCAQHFQVKVKDLDDAQEKGDEEAAAAAVGRAARLGGVGGPGGPAAAARAAARRRDAGGAARRSPARAARPRTHALEERQERLHRALTPAAHLNPAPRVPALAAASAAVTGTAISTLGGAGRAIAGCRWQARRAGAGVARRSRLACVERCALHCIVGRFHAVRTGVQRPGNARPP